METTTSTKGASTHTINLPGSRLRRYAHILLHLHPRHQNQPIRQPQSEQPIRVVCISDTHNTQPDLPPGDILIHAGDITEFGHFDELQSQINWLSSQPHPHKVIIAGNHDTLLHPPFLAQHPRYNDTTSKTLHDLHWPSNLHYLCDTSITLTITPSPPSSSSQNDSPRHNRTINIFGSPWTPQYGISAFQYCPHQNPEFWKGRIPSNTDIVVTHGPPRLHLDKTNIRHSGCPLLGREIARVRPKLHVFGHIHVGYGREDVVLDGVRRRYEEVVNFASFSDWDVEGWWLLVQMLGMVVVARAWIMLSGFWGGGAGAMG